MSLINRLTTWSVGQLLTSANLNGEFNNIVNLLNNLDAQSTSWDGIKTASLVSTGTTSANIAIAGVNDGSSASAGNIGEVIRSYASGASLTASGTWTNIASISLTAGDWDVSGVLTFNNSGTYSSTNNNVAISADSGTSTGDHVDGDNQVEVLTTSGTGGNVSTSIPSFHVNISSTTTYYLKALMNYNAGGSQSCSGRISARRER